MTENSPWIFRAEQSTPAGLTVTVTIAYPVVVLSPDRATCAEITARHAAAALNEAAEAIEVPF